MDKTTHEVRRSHWEQIIKQCQDRPAGMSAKQWMTENSIREKSYYYWQRLLRKEAYEQMRPSQDLPAIPKTASVSFAEIPVPLPDPIAGLSSITQPAAVIRVGNATIALSNEISDRLLSMILQEASHA